VDFIVYGNAFDGFGEAGAAQVSEDGTIWYDLAGSLYYRDDANTLTQNNVDVGYKIEDGAIQYKVTASDGKILHDWDTLIDSAGWWPTVAKNYPNVAGADAARPYASTPVTGVYYDPAGLITHERRTLVDGVTINKRFAFGYADTHANSESYDYGVAINPYLNAMGGGDGFDLSWAVDENGAPVSLSEVKYVRIYTASVLDTEKSTPENPVFTLGGFGDISTEVCGLYRTINTGSGVFTPAATVSYGSSTYTTSPVSNTQGITNVTLPATASSRTYTIDSLSAGNAYINSEKMTAATQTLTVTLARGQTALYRIITQSADGNAYVNLVRFTRL
jgi:hypothetical protein